MKMSFILAMLFIGATAYYVTGGGALTRVLGLSSTAAVPDTIDAPNATFIGDEQKNPFVKD